jgi:hypothetical protein
MALREGGGAEALLRARMGGWAEAGAAAPLPAWSDARRAASVRCGAAALWRQFVCASQAAADATVRRASPPPQGDAAALRPLLPRRNSSGDLATEATGGSRSGLPAARLHARAGAASAAGAPAAAAADADAPTLLNPALLAEIQRRAHARAHARLCPRL